MVISYFPLASITAIATLLIINSLLTQRKNKPASELNCRARLTHDKPNRPWGAPSKLTYIVQQVEQWRTRERQIYKQPAILHFTDYQSLSETTSQLSSQTRHAFVRLKSPGCGPFCGWGFAAPRTYTYA